MYYTVYIICNSTVYYENCPISPSLNAAASVDYSSFQNYVSAIMELSALFCRRSDFKNSRLKRDSNPYSLCCKPNVLINSLPQAHFYTQTRTHSNTLAQGRTGIG